MNKTIFEYDIDRIKKNGGLSEVFDVDVKLFSNCLSPITTLNSMKVKVDFFVNQSSVVLYGSIKAKATILCSRCAKACDVNMSEDFEDVYENNNIIDIKPLIDEALTLSEPLKFICKPDCISKHIEDFNLERFKIKEGENYAKPKKKTH